MKLVFKIIILLCISSSSNAFSSNKWFKGNTHSHSIIFPILHGDSFPGTVAKWYASRGYNFLGLSNHNKFTKPEKIRIKKKYRDNFILIPASEITSDHRVPGAAKKHKRILHTTAWNIDSPVDWTFKDEPVSDTIQRHINRTIQANGFSILNHPNFRGQVTTSDILKLKNLRHFEVYNSAPFSRNSGSKKQSSTDEIWDDVLSSGKILFGIATDDAHHFNKLLIKTGFDIITPPGGAWIMVNAPKLTPKAISNAIWTGDFYSTTGIILKELKVENERLSIEIDPIKSRLEMIKKHVRAGAPANTSIDYGYEVKFITDKGVTYKKTTGLKHNVKIEKDMGYLRAKITYYESLGQGKRKFFAWTQPIFTDERQDILAKESLH